MLDQTKKKPELPKNLFFYFFQLDKKDLQDFKKNWKELEKYRFQRPQTSAQILQKTAKHLQGYKGKDNPDYNACLKYLNAHMGIWETQALEKIDQFNPQGLANSLWAYASLGIEPRAEFAQAWETQALEKIDQFNPQDLANSLWSCAVLHSITEDEQYKNLYNITSKHISGVDLSCNEIKKQMHDAQFWFEGKTLFQNPERQERKSNFERQARTLFEDVYDGVKDSDGALRKIFKKAGDFDVIDKTSVTYEIDGPTHYVRNWKTGEVRLNGATRFRSAILNKSAPQNLIVRLGYQPLKVVTLIL
jgi:hypothetical protein